MEELLIRCLEIQQDPGYLSYLGLAVIPEDDEDAWKEQHYQNLKQLAHAVLRFLQRHEANPKVVNLLIFAHQQLAVSKLDVTYVPALWLNNLEVAYARYRPLEFMDYVEMSVHYPMLQVTYHLSEIFEVPYPDSLPIIVLSLE